MDGWLVSVVYDVSGGRPSHEATFATWVADSAKALRAVTDFEPRGSEIAPRLIAQIPASALRGLKLSPGETGLLVADTTRP